MRAAAQETIKLIKDLDMQRSFEEDTDPPYLGEIEPLIDTSEHKFDQTTISSVKIEPNQKFQNPYLVRSKSPLASQKPKVETSVITEKTVANKPPTANNRKRLTSGVTPMID